MNVAGIPWENVQALRRKGVDARLVVFERARLHHEADWSLDRRGPLPVRLAQQLAAFARLGPTTDVFHFYFGLTLLPKSVQFPLLKALRKKSVFHSLGSDIRGKRREELDHREAFERYRAADIVVDQLNAGWYGVFAIEAMALGKPVVTFLHDEAVRRTEQAFGVEVPLVSATAETLVERLRPLVED
ncbi:MAG TPA: hypothetical protein VFJ93_02430, partial [Gaiellaceae bacterium]|nr:hypothetical protein [Gaiellaceae bacterium]